MSPADILTFLAEIVLSSGIIWAAIMALKRAFRRHLSPRAHLAVWLVLVVRLVLPMTFETGLHFSLLPAAVSGGTAVSAAGIEDQTCATAADQLSFALPTLAVSGSGAAYVGEDTEVQRHSEALCATASGPSFKADPAELAVCIWILGMLLSTVLSLRGYDRLRRDVRHRLVPGAAPLHQLFHECLEEAGIRSRVVLAVQNELAGPALLYPNIILVPDSIHDMRGETAKMALRHELTHLVRRDHLKSFGLNILRIVWWFNPFVWLAVRAIREDIETACDADVVRPLGKNGRRAYARAVLSMYGRTETCQAVLGMAFGGAKKNAEKRIRGIYMKKKSSVCGRSAAICLAGILSVACFTTACQPTPEQEAVVNQKDGALQEVLDGEPASIDPLATAAPAAQYSAQEHWTETVDKADNFKITADTDVMVPDVTAYPVEKLAAGDMTQEMADRLIDRFAPDAAFYEPSTAANRKEHLEREIEKQQEILADQKADGQTREAAQTESKIADLREAAENAPGASERIAASTEYTYSLDADGNPREEAGRIYIQVDAETPDGRVSHIAVRRANPSNPVQFPYFYYQGPRSTYTTRTQDLATLEHLAEDIDSADLLEEPYRSDELDRLKALSSAAQERLDAYDNVGVDLETAREKGASLLEELGIEGMEITVCEAASLSTGETLNMEQDFGTPGAYMEFCREVGGIPCVSPEDQDVDLASCAALYSAPFMPEHGTIVVDSDWQVEQFTWESPTDPVEIVASDAQLMPLSEAQERLVEELYRRTYLENYDSDYDIDEMYLVMGYVDSADEQDRAVAVPAWYMRAHGTVCPSDGSNPYTRTQEIMLNAIDGAPILMPCSLQRYNANADEAD